MQLDMFGLFLQNVLQFIPMLIFKRIVNIQDPQKILSDRNISYPSGMNIISPRFKKFPRNHKIKQRLTPVHHP